MSKQKIEMQELPAGVFTFEEIGLVINHLNFDKLLAITSVEVYNDRLNSFPLTVVDLEKVPNLVLTKQECFINIEDLSNEWDRLDPYNETLQEIFEGIQYLVLFDPKTGERIACR
jgi:hypothetical protein